MRLPAIWPALGFAAGLLLFGNFGRSGVPRPAVFLLSASLAIIAGFLFLHKSWFLPAGATVLAAWICLGFAAAEFERAAIPANLASAMIASGSLDSSVPLRWRGRMRGEPEQLPWGKRYEISLEKVESASGMVPVSGGLRLTSYEKDSNAQEAEELRAGTLVEALARAVPARNFGNPGSFDFQGYLATVGVDLQGTLRSESLLTVLEQRESTLADRLNELRGRLFRSIDALFSSRPDHAALARAMLLGDRTFVDRDEVIQFQKTGVYHVLVLAGLHVAGLVAFFLWAARRLRFTVLATTALILAVLAAYLGIVEDRAPILRAALMAAIYLLTRLWYRRADLLNVAALSALIILLARPSSVTEASFLLSFSAIAIIGGIAVPWLAVSSEPYLRGLTNVSDRGRDVSYAPRIIQFRIDLRTAAAWLAARLPQRLRSLSTSAVVLPLRSALWIWDLLVISAILQFGMLAPMAYYFHRITLAGPLANLPAVVLTGFIVPLGFFTLGLATLSPAAGRVLAWPLGALLSGLESSVRWFARWQHASYRVPGPPAMLLLIFAVAAILLSLAIRWRNRAGQLIAAPVLLAASALIAIHPFAPHLSGNNLEVTLIDVGQGDSLFVAFPDGRTMLVDGGGLLGSFQRDGIRAGIDVGEDVVSPYLWSRGIKRIDVVALTHAHQDHLGGLPAILENFRVRELWLGRNADAAALRPVLAAAQQHGVQVMLLKQGDTFDRGSVNGTVVWPEDDSGSRQPKNDDSLVIRLTEGSQSILLAGDIERPSERNILADGQVVSADFLKVAHHGSKTSTTDPFLAGVHPSIAAISVGKDNSFGHPAPEVLERLEAAGVHVYRTDRDGAISVISDGKTLAVTTFLHPASEPDSAAPKP